MGELETKKEFVTPIPDYPATAVARQPTYETMIRAQQNNNISKLRRKLNRIQAEIDATPLTEPTIIDTLEEEKVDVANEILQAEYDVNTAVQVPPNWRKIMSPTTTRTTNLTFSLCITPCRTTIYHRERLIPTCR